MHKIFVVLLAVPTLAGMAQAQRQAVNPTPEKSTVAQAVKSVKSIPENRAIQFGGFLQLTKKLQSVREGRRVPIETFLEMSRDSQTIILDTRSKRAFDLVHLAGAVHLNFSDFSAQKLRQVIPSKDTRILIYCNNNFKEPAHRDSPIASRDGTEKNADGVVQGFTPKLPTLALNIPTFINLHGYGYENLYELADQIEVDDSRLQLVGTAVKKD